MKAFEWANASSAEDAVKLLKPADANVDADEIPRAIGGGQDLLTTMKAFITRPPRVVNLKTIKGLDQIQVEGGRLRMGATAVLSEIETHPEIGKLFPGLQEAAKSIATPQIRHLGTVGGNLCQRPRCWYFRLEEVICRKKGGTTCYAATGQNKYNAIFDTGPSNIVHPSDLATMLTALNATLTITGPTGPRTIPISEFFVTPDKDVRRENILKDGEIVTEIQVPATTAKSAYLKFKERESLDFAIAACAAVVDFNPDKTVKTAKLVLGGVASVPWNSPAAAQYLVGKQINEQTVNEAAKMALADATPLEHNGYKVPLAQTMIRRALAKVNA
jgi:xanthine dehydrogenase YagS FAD-binding subunit